MPIRRPIHRLYFGLSLGGTFALNMLLGIPAYATVARAVLV